MLRVGYFEGFRLHIKDYDHEIHKNKILCAQGHRIIAKKGKIRDHHFCHKNGEGDDNCGGKIGSWHLWWQSRLNPKNIELRFNKEVLKIADCVNIVNNNLTIVEFQKSKMDREEMAFREKFYTRRDLMSQWGVPDCTSKLIWIFHLLDCDIEIEYLFGDIVCFRWRKGTKFMLNSKLDGNVTTYYDLGKRDLIQIHKLCKPKILATKFVGRLIPLSKLDKTIFRGITKSNLDESETRMDTHKIEDFIPIKSRKKRTKVLNLAIQMYIEEDISVQEEDIWKFLGSKYKIDR